MKITKYNLNEAKSSKLSSFIKSLIRTSLSSTDYDVFSNQTSSKKKYAHQIEQIQDKYSIDASVYSVHHINGDHSDDSKDNIVLIPTIIHNKINNLAINNLYNLMLPHIKLNLDVESISKLSSDLIRSKYYLKRLSTTFSELNIPISIDMNILKEAENYLSITNCFDISTNDIIDMYKKCLIDVYKKQTSNIKVYPLNL